MDIDLNNNHEKARYLYTKGRDAFEKNNIEEAIKYFTEASELAVHFKTLELLGECYLKINQYEKAIIYLASAAMLNKGVRSVSLLVEAMVKSNDVLYMRNASEFIELALQRDPKNKKSLAFKKLLTVSTEKGR